MTLFVILLLSHNKKGVDISMRKDIKIENMNIGGKKMNKSALARQYGVDRKQ